MKNFWKSFWEALFGQKVVIDGQSIRIKRKKNSITLYTSSGIVHLGNSNTGSIRQGDTLIEFDNEDLFINGEKV
jgi:hypothetical protein